MDESGNPLFWILAVALGVPYLTLAWAYRRLLSVKRISLVRLLDGDRFQRYINAYDPTGTDPEAAISRLFEKTYHWRAYVLPIATILIVTFAASVLLLAAAEAPMGLPTSLKQIIDNTPRTAYAGFAGAYLWCLLDLLQRYRAFDLTPISLHFLWLRLLAGPVVSAVFAAQIREPGDLVLAFVVGVFPLQKLAQLARATAQQHLKLGNEPAEQPNLHKLQGLTRDVIGRLEEEGCFSTQHLANADPVNLLIKTGFEWKVILDIVDQAILYNYVGDKLEALRPIGVRGAIELVELSDPKNDEMILLIATELGQKPVAVEKLIYTLREDPQVDFIWTLWGETI